jgi:alpha-galactosidase
MENEDRAYPFRAWAPRPPMGWNSWDCFATTVTEEQVRAQAAFMAERLKAFGWEYVVVDIQWYEPAAGSYEYRAEADPCLDAYGRLQPAPNRFPSAAGGSGFKALADHVHGLGLKFGIHLMRGIPRLAVKRKLPILGTELHAGDIADLEHVCPWNPDMFGVDMAKPGAQEYYDSVFSLISGWGVDFVKVDDLSRPYFQNLPEVEAIRRAIDKTGRPMALSLSPGATDIQAAEHVAAHANLWRISDDFWDRWLALRDQFWRLAAWNDQRKPGAWPDADMLPLGAIALGKRSTRFTREEQVCMMSLWCIARSPLMHGGDLTKTDDFTFSLLSNAEVLAVNQRSAGNRPLWEREGFIAWTAEDPESGDAYLALFNLRDRVCLEEESSRHPAAALSAAAKNEHGIDIEIKGGEKIFLIARPASHADGFVPVAWIAPRFVFPDGSERSLADYGWTSADAQWDSASMKKANGGEPDTLRALASAVIEYAIPAEALRFRAKVRAEGTAGGSVKVTTAIGTAENEDRRASLPVEVPLAELGVHGESSVRDLWTHEELGKAKGSLIIEVPFHGARLLRLRLS